MKKGDFEKYVDFVKNACEQGMCTKSEASIAILDKAIEMIRNVRIDKKQFMMDRQCEVQYDNAG